MSKRRIRKTRHLFNRYEGWVTLDERVAKVLAARKTRIEQRQAAVAARAVPPGER